MHRIFKLTFIERKIQLSRSNKFLKVYNFNSEKFTSKKFTRKVKFPSSFLIFVCMKLKF